MSLCFSCKWMGQAKGCCKCFNPKQTDNKLINYVYWNDGCSLHEKGDKPTDEEYKELGYEKHKETGEYADGASFEHEYYTGNGR